MNIKDIECSNDHFQMKDTFFVILRKVREVYPNMDMQTLIVLMKEKKVIDCIKAHIEGNL